MKLIVLIFIIGASAFAQQKTGDSIAAEKAAMSVMKGIRQKLNQEMAKNLVNSIEFCHEKAIPLTTDFFKEHERVTEVKRTSLKIRNPANMPDAREQAVLNAWAKMDSKKQKLPPFEMESVSENEIRYYKPLRVEAMCLTCHGTPSGELAAAIKKKYPDDKATGFKEGDLRGLIRVSLKPLKVSPTH
jgi:hypothetical protein